MAVSLSVSITQNSQNVANNTSNVTVAATISWTYGSWNAYKQCHGSITIDGVVHQFADKISFNTGQTTTGSQVVMTKTIDIPHNSDGTKTLNCSAVFYVYLNTTNSVSGSASKVLTTIARASQPSLVTWPNTTQNVGDFGATFSIHMNRNSDSFTHTVRYEYGSRTGTIATGVGTGTTWAVPVAFMNDIPNATSGSGRIYVDTYNGSSLVGTKYTGFTATVPASVKPTCTIALDDTTGVDDIYGSPVKGLSKIKVTVSATQAYSSPIDSYSISVNGETFKASTGTTGVLTKSGEVPVNVTVKDKRGRTGTASYTMNVQNYTAPAIGMLTVRRCDSDGTENAQGEYCQLAFNATVASMSGKNTAVYTCGYKKSSASSWTNVSLTALNNNYAPSNSTYTFKADSNVSYDVKVTVTDRHGSATRSTSVSTAFTILNWHQDGTGLGVGKVSEKSGTLEIALDADFTGKLTGTIFDAILPVGSIIMRYDHTSPNTLYPGTTWTRIENRFLWATTSGGTIGQTGGASTHTLTVNELPAHSHGSVYSAGAEGEKKFSWLATGNANMAYGAVSTGGGEAHNNMPPYIQVSIWRRTA